MGAPILPPVPRAGTQNGKAIASMVLGILGLVMGWVIGPFAMIFTILALVFGFQGRREIRASGGTQGGEGMATAGITMGWIGIAFFVLLIIVVVLFGVAMIGFSAR